MVAQPIGAAHGGPAGRGEAQLPAARGRHRRAQGRGQGGGAANGQGRMDPRGGTRRRSRQAARGRCAPRGRGPGGGAANGRSAGAAGRGAGLSGCAVAALLRSVPAAAAPEASGAHLPALSLLLCTPLRSPPAAMTEQAISFAKDFLARGIAAISNGRGPDRARVKLLLRGACQAAGARPPAPGPGSSGARGPGPEAGRSRAALSARGRPGWLRGSRHVGTAARGACAGGRPAAMSALGRGAPHARRAAGGGALRACALGGCRLECACAGESRVDGPCEAGWVGSRPLGPWTGEGLWSLRLYWSSCPLFALVCAGLRWNKLRWSVWSVTNGEPVELALRWDCHP